MSEESDRDLAVKTLREICSDLEAPKQAKATAARTLLELVGEIGKLQSEKPRDTRALHELTREELDAEIARASKTSSKPNGVDADARSVPGEKRARSLRVEPGRRPKARRSAVQKRKTERAERAKYDF